MSTGDEKPQTTLSATGDGGEVSSVSVSMFRGEENRGVVEADVAEEMVIRQGGIGEGRYVQFSHSQR